MEMSGEQLIAAPQQAVWNALNDPQFLKACVPGCEAITPIADNQYEVLMTARVGPVSARFKGKLTLSDIQPPSSYALAFEGQGGAAGFAKGSAKVNLATQGLTTRLAYDVKASVGGKLAQIGSRLVDAAAKKVADDFFKGFNERMSAQQPDEEATVIGHHQVMDEKKPKKEAAPRALTLPKIDPTTLMFFAGGSLVVFVVSLFALFG
jgi:hypothetical protein